MTPINNYFSEENRNRRQAADAAAVERIEDDKRQRMLNAIEAYSQFHRKTTKKKRERVRIEEETILAILGFYLNGYSVSAIGRMMDLNETDVFNALQLPLIKKMAGSANQYLHTAGKTTRIYPNSAAILAELDELGETVEQFKLAMQARTGASDYYLKRLCGETEGFVMAPLAAEVCRYFGMCADKLFRGQPIEKEKTAE